MERSVLYIDPDRRARQQFCDRYGSRFDVDLADDLAEAQACINPDRPHAIVVAPVGRRGFDGLAALAAIVERSPFTVAICLARRLQVGAALAAQDAGTVFRIVRQPGASEVLDRAMKASLTQHRLLASERELLQATLTGTVQALVDSLGELDGTGVPTCEEITEAAVELAGRAGLEDLWELRMACKVHRIGMLALPLDVRSRLSKPILMTRSDHDELARVPERGARMLETVPRMEGVVAMVRYQSRPYSVSETTAAADGNGSPIGARILHVVQDYLALRQLGQSEREALYQLRGRDGEYDPELLDHWESLRLGVLNVVPLELAANKERLDATQLYSGLTLALDVYTEDKRLLLAKGTVLTPAMVDRLQRFARSDLLHHEFIVYAADHEASVVEEALSEAA